MDKTTQCQVCASRRSGGRPQARGVSLLMCFLICPGDLVSPARHFRAVMWKSSVGEMHEGEPVTHSREYSGPVPIVGSDGRKGHHVTRLRTAMR